MTSIARCRSKEIQSLKSYRTVCGSGLPECSAASKVLIRFFPQVSITNAAVRLNNRTQTTKELSMQKITTHLWFARDAKEAAEFYTSAFSGKDSRIKNTTTLGNTPSGSVDLVTIELFGQEFTLISAGPLFKFNPSVSFLVACKTKDEVESLWKQLSKGGTARMELGEYPFSEKYGWIQDRYGLSWQVMFVKEREIKQRITPAFMFVGDVCGKTEEAINF